MSITTTDIDIESRLSIAYLAAVAARAGCTVTEAPGPDKQSIDVSIRPISGLKSQVDFQIKATTKAYTATGEVFYDLGIKNYNDLRAPSTNPHYLYVLYLPVDKLLWAKISFNQLMLRGRAFFFPIANLGPVSNSATKRVFAPIDQILDIRALEEMIQNAPSLIGTSRT